MIPPEALDSVLSSPPRDMTRSLMQTCLNEKDKTPESTSEEDARA
jgi:hypothetical protein